MKYLILLFLALSVASCTGQSCDSLPSHYKSYTQAVKTVRRAHFKVHQSCNTSSSSWVRAAEYYSCNGKTGYFLFKTDKRWYIHVGVPLSVWGGFKDAESKGKYYNTRIRGKYRFTL